MIDLLEALRFVNIVGGAVLIGAMFMEFAVVLPTFRRLSPAVAVPFLGTMGPQAWRVMPPFGVASGVAAAAILVFRYGELSTRAIVLTAVGLAFTGCAVASNLFFYLPVEKQMRSFAPEATREEYARALTRLTTRHVVRLVFFSAGFVCFVLAALEV